MANKGLAENLKAKEGEINQLKNELAEMSKKTEELKKQVEDKNGTIQACIITLDSVIHGLKERLCKG